MVAAGGPWIVAAIASRGADAFDSAVTVLFYVGFVPLAGLLLLPFVTETKDLALTD